MRWYLPMFQAFTVLCVLGCVAGCQGPRPMGEGRRVDPDPGARVEMSPMSPMVDSGPMALGDCNGDGLLDLFVGSDPPVLMVQRAGGGFDVRPMKITWDRSEAALGTIGNVGRSALSDLDGDGNQDLVITPASAHAFTVN